MKIKTFSLKSLTTADDSRLPRLVTSVVFIPCLKICTIRNYHRWSQKYQATH